MKRTQLRRYTTLKRNSRLRRRSKKLSMAMREYIPTMVQWLIGKKCKSCADLGIDKKAEVVHHKRGRHSIERLLAKKWWMPCCWFHNGEIERRKEWARANGYLLNRQADKPKRLDSNP